MRNTHTHESELLDSRQLRSRVIDRVDALDKVKTLRTLPDGLHVTTRMVAAYYEVSVEVVRKIVVRHRPELEDSGLRTLRGAELHDFLRDNLSIRTPGRGLTLYPRRAVLNVGMLLRDSVIARQVRSYLLDTEAEARLSAAAEPVDNFPLRALHELERHVQRLVDERMVAVAEESVRQVIRTAVTPLLNHLIETSGEHRQRLLEIRDDLQRLQTSRSWRPDLG
ncbi:restriction endonuclease [Streptomyces millisiae]|uniref:Restriction endonuclease n=1 Tax=Streptomyces millisiae TaxID=3075542 RepID=A0ABU2LRE5_9ACTN|nr:restriction endonuclease [Streptomyces sp. DSM 44918]MDT0320131.1 restriction endonuclease [Streptomyces sp. DSM 44918]